MDPSQLQRGLKLILKVGSNSTPEYSSGNSPLPLSALGGPPTAAEAMMSAAPSSPLFSNACHSAEEGAVEQEHRERHKKSKKKKKKKDREKKHKHHKEKRHRGEKHEHHQSDKNSEMETNDVRSDVENEGSSMQGMSSSALPLAGAGGSSNMGSYRSPQKSIPSTTILGADGDSSQDGFSFMDDDNSQPLPENILMYAGINTDNSPSCRPVSKPIVPMAVPSPAGSSNAATSPTKPLPDVSF